MRYPHDIFLDSKVRAIAKEKTVYDIGGGPGFQKWLKQYKPLFANVDYKTVDYNANLEPDIVGDIHHLPFEDGSIPAIICYAVLAHVRDPIRAVEEMQRVLVPGGKLLVYVPSIYPYIAAKGKYPDYWRFFDDTIEMLFGGWSRYEYVKVGGYFKALFFFIPYQHRIRWLIDPLSHVLDTLFRTKERHTTSGYIIYATKI